MKTDLQNFLEMLRAARIEHQIDPYFNDTTTPPGCTSVYFYSVSDGDRSLGRSDGECQLIFDERDALYTVGVWG